MCELNMRAALPMCMASIFNNGTHAVIFMSSQLFDTLSLKLRITQHDTDVIQCTRICRRSGSHHVTGVAQFDARLQDDIR